MNIHPILVHFPIALLTVYALLELVRFKKIQNQPYWFYVKACFAILGTLGAFAALLTGDMAKEAVMSGSGLQPSVDNFKAVVNMHENFADLSVLVFSLISFGYILLWLNRQNIFSKIKSSAILKLAGWLLKLAHFLVETPFIIVLALLGLACITITGGLGGVMVYGSGADPFFGFIYKLMFPN